jgi:uncharacterized Zn finger protein
MDLKAIKKYIKIHGNPNSRSNSNYVYPVITEYATNKFEFECEGSYGDYIIKIDIENNNISTSCTCPYKNSYSGICKHVIASLKTIMEDYNGASPTIVPEKKTYTLFEELPVTTANKIEKIKTNQAIDRCYRIGQTKKVMAYRMICKDTIEEKIVSLQQKKKKVASSIISIDDEKKSFDINEVKELFR